jgi:predicted transcriptional regulator
MIRDALSDTGLRTEPDFEEVSLDAMVVLATIAKPSQASGPPVTPSKPDLSPEQIEGEALAPRARASSEIEPSYRISRLPAANRPPVAVRLDGSLQEAITLLIAHDFSQLPVMSGDRDVRGVISWRSIGRKIGLGLSCRRVGECLEPAVEIRSDDSILSAVQVTSRRDYVLVRGLDNKITGIVTTSDLTEQFGQFSEPFLLIGEIERHLRIAIDRRFSATDLAACVDPRDAGRSIMSAADLSFGEYARLLENTQRWAKAAIPLDKSVFLSRLRKVRQIRNDVMHFDPDGIVEDDLRLLREFVDLLHAVDSATAT